METITTQVKNLASTANEAARKKMIDQLRDLSYSLESPDDTLQRIMYLVGVARIAGIFVLLSDLSAP